MRAVFLKEWRQGHLFIIFGLLMAGLLPGLYVLCAVAFVRTWLDRQALDMFWGFGYLLLPVVIALFVGAGIVVSEVQRGTLPLLLALPVSRRRIWLAKLLAGFSLAAASSAIAVAPGYFALPGTFAEVNFPLFAPDLAIWFVIVFVVAFFWSTLSQRTISVLLASLVLLLALAPVIALMLTAFGGSLLGYDVLLDYELWSLTLLPALLAASYVAFTRGGLLQSRRKWWLAIPALVVVLLAVSSLVVGVTRWATRYQREAVQVIQRMSFAPGSPTLAIQVEGQPVPLERSYADGWVKPSWPEYRSQHVVLLDLDDGRELLVRRGPLDTDVAVSPDGSRAAFLAGPPALTWRRRDLEFEPRLVEVWDLESRRCTYRGLPREFWERGRFTLRQIDWSPDGSWLLIGPYPPPGMQRSLADALARARLVHWRDLSLLLVRPDETGPRVIPCWQFDGVVGGGTYAWDPSPAGSVLYTLEPDQDALRLRRRDLGTDKVEAIWEAPAPSGPLSGYEWVGATISVSPEGRWIAVVLIARQPPDPDARRSAPVEDLSIYAVPADGSPAVLIHHHPRRENSYSGAHPTWSSDGTALYFRVAARAIEHYGGESDLETRGTLRVMRWVPGEAEAAYFDIPYVGRSGSLEALPNSGDLLLWGWRTASVVSRDGAVIPLPHDRLRALALDTYLLGFDHRGRAILKEWPDEGSILAADLATGEITPLYP